MSKIRYISQQSLTKQRKMVQMKEICKLSLIIVLLLSATNMMFSQAVDQARGTDQSVNYESLKDIGPWDDRNYDLTASDLALLAPNELELVDPIPAFYRVELRKRFPELLRTGPAQYPRSALQKFNLEYLGYLVDGEYYRQLDRANNRYEVLTKEPLRTIQSKKTNRKMAVETRVTNPNGAAESAIKIHPLDPNIVIAGSNGPGGGQKMHYSHNGGLSWTQVDLPLGGTCCDPTIDYSSDGAFAYSSTLGNGVYIYRSSDNGVTWTDLETLTPGDPRREIGVGSSDKQYLHVDKFCNSPFKDNVYITWHEGNTMQFSRSTDMGNTWAPKTSFSADPRGIGSDITTDQDGTIYYVWPATSDRSILLKRSTDGGSTFENGTIKIADTEGGFDFPIPVMFRRLVFIYTALDTDFSSGPFSGSIYAAWTDNTAPDSGNPANNHARIQVGYSRDQGATWTIVTPHSTADMNSVDRFHPWLAVDVEGNVHVVFYDTRNSANRDGVDFYHTVSTDGAQTFSPPERLTSTTSPLINDGFEWGDYNGLDHVVRRSTIFTDNRDESGGSSESVDVYSTTTLQGGVNYSMNPETPTSISGPTTICPGQSNIPFDVSETVGADTYQWSYSQAGTTINNNGSGAITIDGITSAGTVSVFAENVCGTSSSINFNVALAPTATCDIVDCVLNNYTINDPEITQSDVFDIILNIDSEATVTDGSAKVFRALEGIEMKPGFTAELNAFFVAQIEDCR